jgi:diguanylate cyclase (GGDEF)-like protein
MDMTNAEARGLLLILVLLEGLTSVFLFAMLKAQQRFNPGILEWAIAIATMTGASALGFFGTEGSNEFLLLFKYSLLSVSGIFLLASYFRLCSERLDLRSAAILGVIGLSGISISLIKFSSSGFAELSVGIELIIVSIFGAIKLFKIRSEKFSLFWVVLLGVICSVGIGVLIKLAIFFYEYNLDERRVFILFINNITWTSFAIILIVVGTYSLIGFWGERNFHQLKENFSKDTLSGLLTRREFCELAARALAEEKSKPLALFLIDIDEFKKINDRHGHAAGDKVIGFVGSRILESIRGGDLAGRYGGDEFCVLMKNCEMSMARLIAERIVIDIASASDQVKRFGGIDVSVSIGYVSSDLTSCFESCASLDDFLESADQALYLAKAKGRNKAVSAPIRVLA